MDLTFTRLLAWIHLNGPSRATYGGVTIVQSALIDIIAQHEGDVADTMHVTPDSHAVQLLGQASGKVQTMCGDVEVDWQHAPGKYFAMNAQIPHNCGRAKLVLYVPTPATSEQSTMCVNKHSDDTMRRPPRSQSRRTTHPGATSLDTYLLQ